MARTGQFSGADDQLDPRVAGTKDLELYRALSNYP